MTLGIFYFVSRISLKVVFWNVIRNDSNSYQEVLMAKTRLKVEERDDQCWVKFPWPRAEVLRRVDRGGHRMEDGKDGHQGVRVHAALCQVLSEVPAVLSTQKISMATVCSIWNHVED